MKFTRKIKFYLIRLFRLKSGVRQISLGFVVGFFPCWFPTFGVGPALSVLLTKITKGNVPSAIIAASLGSFLWPILFLMNYKAGEILDAVTGFYGEQVKMGPVASAQPVTNVESFTDIGVQFVVGSVFNSIFFSLIGYFIFYYIFRRYRHTILAKLRGKGVRRQPV
ncbi:DUF2062 domain-containing protein [Brevibacillus humidisoli]|uniref:DUF2062 domain-containing protein n=1 Tax=Brevibacillus humidisoli TaxID=2895522 RepID=UPI001E2FA4DD|nr:DUF2062 domain-containing protein [Brevibacillus humidisoli]UFJ41501.1 DUF2062 domain-containing protein [Brevibacillus humidisoli]